MFAYIIPTQHLMRLRCGETVEPIWNFESLLCLGSRQPLSCEEQGNIAEDVNSYIVLAPQVFLTNIDNAMDRNCNKAE
jgi:hypothetical protein